MGGVLIIHHFFLTHFAQHFQIGFPTTIPNNHSHVNCQKNFSPQANISHTLSYTYIMTNKQYLARRFKRYLSSGCVLCWDYCSHDKSFSPKKDEEKAYHGTDYRT